MQQNDTLPGTARDEKEFKHAEAFCQMDYGNSHVILTIWNSRDGVTPFNYVINGQEIRHINWGSDRREPDYKLKVGDLYWRDKTLEEAATEAVRRIGNFMGSPYELKNHTEEYKQALQQMTDEALRIPILDIFK